MEEIFLQNIEINKNKLKYVFTYTDGLEKYFNKKYDFFIEYPDTVNLSKVPQSILGVPFVTNLFPRIASIETDNLPNISFSILII